MQILSFQTRNNMHGPPSNPNANNNVSGKAKFKKYIGMPSRLSPNVYHQGDKGWRGYVVNWGRRELTH